MFVVINSISISIMKLPLIATALLAGSAAAFSVDKPNVTPKVETDRKSFLVGAASLLGGAVLPQAASAIVYPSAEGGFKLGDPKSVLGREQRSFSGLVYAFKNTSLDGG